MSRVCNYRSAQLRMAPLWLRFGSVSLHFRKTLPDVLRIVSSRDDMFHRVRLGMPLYSRFERFFLGFFHSKILSAVRKMTVMCCHCQVRGNTRYTFSVSRFPLGLGVVSRALAFRAIRTGFPTQQKALERARLRRPIISTMIARAFTGGF